MMKRPNKERVNLTVDPEKRAEFDVLAPIHGKTLSDLLDEALDNILKEYSPDVILEIKIRETEIILAEMNANLPEARFLAKRKQSRIEAEVANAQANNEDDNKWLEKYEQGKYSIATQVNKNHIDWKAIAGKWGFKNIQEAEEKITEQLNKDGLLGCQACKKWNNKKSYCKHLGKTTEPNYSCSTWELRQGYR